jgi:dTDP-4-amino-4,6-dideoxygalactose transaminase
MDALIFSLMIRDIGPGDEVVTTPLSAFATTLAILKVGATPVFADVDERTGALDPKRAEAVITARTRALLPVHLYGNPCDATAFDALARAKKISFFGDACQAHGAEHAGRNVAHWGEAVSYSFYPTKNLGAYGDGGALVCSSDADAERVRMLRDYGQRSKYRHEVLGLNSRLDELQAALLRVGLKRLRASNDRRRAIAALYVERLAGLPIALPVERPGDRSACHLFVIRTARRNELMGHLKERHIQSLIHYPTILPAQPAIADRGYKVGQFPIAERFAAECLSLPNHAQLTDAEVDTVCAAVKEFFAR